MPTEPTRAPVNPPEASDGRRLHIHGIKEMPAGYDAEVAELFRDLRAASNLSEADLAATLATRTEVVQALEQGALYALPPWPETSRVVNSYGLLLNLDVRPLLRRIYAQVEPTSTGQDSFAMAEPRAPEPQAAPPRSPLDIPFESDQRQPQAYPETQRAPQQNWAPQPVDRRMQPRVPGAPMPGRLGPQAPQMPPQRQRPPQANPAQGRPPQPPPQPQARPQPMAPQARAPQAQPPGPQPAAASTPIAKPVEAKQAPERKSRRGRAVKWGIAAVVLIAAVSGFLALRSDPGLIGFSNPSQSGAKADKPTDPDDPRTHKADRLPTPNGL
jgi:hypothetical protein